MAQKILAADIGGTNSRFGFFEWETGEELTLVESTWLETKSYASFFDLISAFENSNFPLSLSESDIAVMAVAGPVEDGRYCNPPLIDWDINLREKTGDLDFSQIVLINDFLAQAYSATSPIADVALTVLQGEPQENAAMAVIGAGTGLGKAFLLPNGGDGFVAAPSEGGHGNFTPETKQEFEFGCFVAKKRGIDYPVWNDVVSGRGLTFIHEFLTGDILEPKEVAELFTDSLETLLWASRFYARVARNFVLDTLALGGLFIAGGIAAKNPRLVQSQEFMKTFCYHPTYVHLLERIPVKLIADEESGLWGAGNCGLQMLKKGA